MILLNKHKISFINFDSQVNNIIKNDLSSFVNYWYAILHLLI